MASAYGRPYSCTGHGRGRIETGPASWPSGHTLVGCSAADAASRSQPPQCVWLAAQLQVVVEPRPGAAEVRDSGRH
eukprot:scaffold1670_cov108-Isochrysis_galbana.AAC.9